MPKYEILVGTNYPDGKGGELRAEPGDVVDDLPEKAVKGLLASGAIREAKARRSPKSEPAEPDPSREPEPDEEG